MKSRAHLNIVLKEIKKRLRSLANPERAKVSLRYFKTGPGEYGEGDLFLGNTVPDLRKVAREFRDLSRDQTLQLLQSKYHEERVLALMILNLQFIRGTSAEKQSIHRLYLKNIRWINNWDLVDCSAPVLVGQYVKNNESTLLRKLARSKNLWERRIAIVATYPFIKQKQFGLPLQISTMLIHDKEDLIHKATGWMLREIGKKDKPILEGFLQKHAGTMPRTMLRYAIEKFDEKRRNYYLGMRNLKTEWKES